MFENLLPSGWNFWGRYRKCGFVGRGVLLGGRSEISKVSMFVLSLLYAVDQDVISQLIRHPAIMDLNSLKS